MSSSLASSAVPDCPLSCFAAKPTLRSAGGCHLRPGAGLRRVRCGDSEQTSISSHNVHSWHVMARGSHHAAWLPYERIVSFVLSEKMRELELLTKKGHGIHIFNLWDSRTKNFVMYQRNFSSRQPFENKKTFLHRRISEQFRLKRCTS